MTIRTKGRRGIEVAGRQYIWHVKDDWQLRIASADKRFIVHYNLMRQLDDHGEVTVVGQHFPGLSAERPQTLRCPRLPGDNAQAPGAVRALIEWCLEDEHAG